MKPIIVDIIARRTDKIGAFGTDNPTELTVTVGLIDGLLCSLRIWERDPVTLTTRERDAVEYIAWEYRHAREPVTLTLAIADYLRRWGFIPA